MNKLKEILNKAKDESDKELKREIFDKFKRNNALAKFAQKLEDFVNKRLEKNAFEKVKNITKEKQENIYNEEEKDEIKGIKIRKSVHLLQKYVNTLKHFSSKKFNEEDDSDKNIIEIVQKKNILCKIKKEDNKSQDNNEDIPSPTKRRIAYRTNHKKIYSKKKNKKAIKRAKEKKNSNPQVTKDVDIFDKYQRKVLQALLKVYKKYNNLLLKQYWDKWKKEEIKEEMEENNTEEEILKYKKKPKIEYNKDIEEEDEQDEIQDKETFKPIYFLPKQNLHKQIYENPNIDVSIHEPIQSNIVGNDKETSVPYIKKYGKRNYNSKNHSKYISDISQQNPFDQYHKKLNEKINYNNQDILNNTQSSDNSSEESYLSGVTLIQNNKEIKEPRNYTSQSFFIDKNTINENQKMPINNNIGKNEIYKINEIPNMMKGDFENFIEHNPKIFEKKNPRIQVTRSTCDLGKIINNGNINININTNDNKYISKIVSKCDYDLYANQKSKSKKDKWYSISIPLYQLKQGPNYNKSNENENIEKNENDKIYNNYSLRKPLNIPNKDTILENNGYTLQEMNCSQFYRSPMRSLKKNNYGNRYQLYDSVIKIPGKQRRNIHQSLSPFDIRRRNNEANLGN